MSAKRFTPELVDKIVRAYWIDGESQVSIARKLGTSREKICLEMRKAGQTGRSLSEAARLRERMGRGQCRVRTAP